MLAATWITAISTFIMMIATCFMAYAAWKALKTWKIEEISKRECQCYKDLLEILMQIKGILYEIEYTKVIKDESKIYIILVQILEIMLDFEHLGERENIKFLDEIRKIIQKYYSKKDEKIEDDFCYAYIKNIDNINKDLNKFLNYGRDYCKNKIKKFYKE